MGDAKRGKADHEGALAEYKTYERIAARLANEDEGRATWKRQLALSRQRQGDILLRQGNPNDALDAYGEYFVLVKALAAGDAANQTYDTDVSIGHAKLGDALLRKGLVDEALKHYRVYLERAEQLAKKAPMNALWQRNWAMAHQRLGEALLAQNDPLRALAQFGACRDIPVKHPAVDETNAEPRDVVQHCGKRIDQIEQETRRP